jgi:hypothetical protein
MNSELTMLNGLRSALKLINQNEKFKHVKSRFPFLLEKKVLQVLKADLISLTTLANIGNLIRSMSSPRSIN